MTVIAAMFKHCQAIKHADGLEAWQRSQASITRSVRGVLAAPMEGRGVHGVHGVHR